MPGATHSGLSPDRLNRLLEVGRALVAELDAEAVLRQVLEVARELTGARYAAVGVLTEDGAALERFITAGIDDEAAARIGALPRGRGVLGVLITDPQPLRLADVNDHPRSYGFPHGHPPMRSFLGVPIRIRGSVYGNLYLTEKDEHAEFTTADQESIEVLADWAALAVDNARNHQTLADRGAELERAVGTLRATSDIARAIGGETELDRILELIVKRARATIEARSVLVVLGDRASGMTVAAMAGEGDRTLIGREVALDGTLIGAGAATGMSVRFAEPTEALGLGTEYRPSNGVLAPLLFRGEPLGVLVAGDRARPFSDDDEHLLGSFATSAAVSVATAKRIDEQQRLRAIEASERERARWARELHDETLQDLAGLKVLLGSAGGDSPAMAAALEQIEVTITGLRRLITELRPPVLDEFGLAAAVEGLTDRIAASTGVRVDLETELDDRLAPELESTAYRLVQEAVNNAVQHAEPARVDVRVANGAAALVVEVHDDGRGFDVEAPTTGFGLVGMRERVELVGGALEIASLPGRGTTVRAEFPTRP